jgi:D-alanine-D-alanine ligase
VKRLRVGVVFGGRSSEHEVSVASAASVIGNLDPTRYEAVPIRIERSGRWARADRAPTTASAADAIEQARREAALSSGRMREVHLLPLPDG